MRMKNLRGTAVLAAVGLALAGCASGASSKPQSPPGPVVARGVAIREPLADPRPYGAADTAFGLDLLAAWCRADPQANLVMSPSSLASGLGMAYLGARGTTARAMASVLHLPAAGGQALDAGLQARSAALRALDSPGVTVETSDQAWADPSLATRPAYLNAVATGYGAGLARAPLLSNPDRAAQEISQAVSTATRGQIPQLLPPGSLPDIGWVLTDALYLHADWAAPFQASLTSPAPFATAAGQQVGVPFMNGGQFRTDHADGWTGVWLPYRGGRLGLLALLPPAGAAGCAMPSAAGLGAMTAQLTRTTGIGQTTSAVALPKVKLADTTSMKSLLAALGMGLAFTSAADFTGLSPQACCIGLVQHAATLQVGEQGTVASAATAVGMEPTAARLPPLAVTFDRTYLMLVIDRTTGEPLIAARVTNPAAG
jgi:serine protease inhibitor